MRFYSPETGGFYSASVHTKETEGGPILDVPEDAIEITDDEYADLRAAVREGRPIVMLDDRPVGGNHPDPTPEEAAAAHAERVSIDCRQRIYAVVDQTAQMNLVSVVAAGLLPAADVTTYVTGLQWIAAMRAEYARARDDGDDPSWPDVPAGVADLAARF